MREEDVPAQQPEAQEEARVPYPHAHPGWPRGAQGPSLAGSRPPLGLIWRIRDHATFVAFSGAPTRRARRAMMSRATPVAPVTATSPRPMIGISPGTKFKGISPEERALMIGMAQRGGAVVLVATAATIGPCACGCQ